MAAHSSLTGADLHEPKGVAAASTGTVYIANGSGSGSWSKVGSSNIDTATIFNGNKHVFTTSIADVSTADFALIPFPFACTVNRVTTILHSAITVADATLTVTNSTGPATIGTITVAFTGSAEGTIDQLSAASNNAFTANTYLKIATDGASTTAAKLTIVVEVTRTGA